MKCWGMYRRQHIKRFKTVEARRKTEEIEAT